MRETWNVIWDLPGDPNGNRFHIEEHGLTIDEVEDVLLDANLPVGTSRTSGRPLRAGYTTTGRYIVVVWSMIDDDTVKPVTAYEPT